MLEQIVKALSPVQLILIFPAVIFYEKIKSNKEFWKKVLLTT